MKKNRKVYALYKGDVNICDGTIKEIALFLHTTESNVRCWKSRQAKNKGNRYELVYLGTEEELELLEKNSLEEDILNIYEEDL